MREQSRRTTRCTPPQLRRRFSRMATTRAVSQIVQGVSAAVNFAVLPLHLIVRSVILPSRTAQGYAHDARSMDTA
jgi:hypothetical protein